MSHTGQGQVSDAATGSTGVDAVDEALTSLDNLGDRPVEEHPAVFESVHEALRAVLSDDARA